MPDASRLLGVVLVAAAMAACDSDPTATAAFLTSTTPQVDFGRRDVTSAQVVRAVHIQNTGGSTSGALGVSITGPGAAGFRIDTAGSSCIGQRLGASSGCDVAVRLDGQASGPLTATLVVGAGSQSALVALSGTLVSKLNVYYQGTGHGTVTESAHGTSCIATCTLDLDVPTVTLSAVPDPESNFAGWTGVPGCGTSSTCTMTLIDLNAVTVKFDPM